MKIIEFTVERVGTSVILNGECVPKGVAKVDETVIRKKLHPEHLWALACEARKLSFLLAQAYNEAQVREGEISQAQAERNLAVMKAKRRQLLKQDPIAALLNKDRGGT